MNSTIAFIGDDVTGIYDVTSAQPSSFRSYLEYDVSRWLIILCRPLCCLLGVCGNALCVAVLVMSSLRHSPSAVYLVTLALLDLVISLFAALDLLQKDFAMGEMQFFTQTWHCRLFFFSILFSAHWDTLTLMSMTSQRYVAVRFPLQAAGWLTRRMAVVNVLIAGVIAFLANVIHLTSLELRTPDGSYRGRCAASDALGAMLLTRVYPWLDFALYFFLPSSLILLLNVLILKALRDAPRSFPEELEGASPKELTSLETATMSSSLCVATPTDWQSPGQKNISGRWRSIALRPSPVRASRRSGAARASQTPTGTSSQASRQLTRMLLVISLVFLLLTLPLGVFVVIFRLIWNPSSGHEKAAFGLYRDVAETLMYVNHAINIVLYWMAGSRIRCKVKAVLRRLLCYCCAKVDGS